MSTTPLSTNLVTVQNKGLSPSQTRLELAAGSEKVVTIAAKVLNSGQSVEAVSKLTLCQRLIVWLGKRWWTEATVVDQSGQFHKVLVNIKSVAKRLNLEGRDNIINACKEGTLNDYVSLNKKVLVEHGYTQDEIQDIEKKIREFSNQNSDQPLIQTVYRSESRPIIYYRGKFGLINNKTSHEITVLSTGETESFFRFLSKEFDEKAAKVFSTLCDLDTLNIKQRLEVAFKVDSAAIPENTDPNVFVPIAQFLQPDTALQNESAGCVAYKNNELYLIVADKGLTIRNLSTGQNESIEGKIRPAFAELWNNRRLNAHNLLKIVLDVKSASLPENTDPNVLVPIAKFYQPHTSRSSDMAGCIAYQNGEIYLITSEKDLSVKKFSQKPPQAIDVTKEIFDEKAEQVFLALRNRSHLNAQTLLEIALDVKSAAIPEDVAPNVLVPIAHFNQAIDDITGYIAYKNNEFYLLDTSARDELHVINLSSSSAQPKKYGLILRQDLSEDEIQKNLFSAERQNEGSEPLSNYGYIQVKSSNNEFSTYQVTSLSKEKKKVRFNPQNQVRVFNKDVSILEAKPVENESDDEPFKDDDFQG